jgi:hypothetical protein
MSTRSARRCVAVVLLGAAAAVTVPATAHAGAEVVRPTGCGHGLAPGDTEVIPGTGLTEFIPASFCQVVFTPTGRANFVIRAELPEGVSFDRALVGQGIVVTPSGRINSHGSFGG